MRILCNKCGKPVSTAVPDDTIVRAWVECPECVKKMPDQQSLMLKLLRKALASLESNIGVQDIYVDYDGVAELQEDIKAIVAENEEVKDEPRG